jgi:hypothetical protein
MDVFESCLGGSVVLDKFGWQPYRWGSVPVSAGGGL